MCCLIYIKIQLYIYVNLEHIITDTHTHAYTRTHAYTHTHMHNTRTHKLAGNVYTMLQLCKYNYQL